MLLEQTVNDSSAKVIWERGLRAAGQPQIEILSQAGEGDLEYKLAIELVPDIKPVDFKTLEFERLVVEVPEKEVTDAIERAAKRFRKSNPVAAPRPARRLTGFGAPPTWTVRPAPIDLPQFRPAVSA